MKKLYVGNLPFQTNEQDLQDWFTQAGVSVSTVKLIRDRFSGDPRGFGFVEIENDDEAKRAIEALNGKELGGRALVVNEARPQQEGGGGGRRDRGGYGGGRGGGRGGRRRDY